jgi:hypothetical protein
LHYSPPFLTSFLLFIILFLDKFLLHHFHYVKYPLIFSGYDLLSLKQFYHGLLFEVHVLYLIMARTYMMRKFSHYPREGLLALLLNLRWKKTLPTLRKRTPSLSRRIPTNLWEAKIWRGPNGTRTSFEDFFACFARMDPSTICVDSAGGPTLEMSFLE